MKPEEFRKEFEEIYHQSKQLNPGDSTENQIQSLIEKFLIDARFAFFLGVKNDSFRSVYNEASSIAGIAPKSGE